MTPPDQPEEAPSALSRLERALAGFGEPKPAPKPDDEPEPVDEEPEPEPEPVDEEPEREHEADEPEPVLVDEDPEPEHEADEPESEPEPDEEEEWARPSSSVLDIAAAVAAVEQLNAPGAEATSAVSPTPLSSSDPDSLLVSPPSDADALVLAATAAGTTARGRDAMDEEEAEPPYFQLPDLRAKIQDFAADDEAEPEPDDDEDEEELPVALDADEEEEEEAIAAEEDERTPDERIADAAESWQRNMGDQTLPYFLVEDNLPAPAAADPEPITTVEELREKLVRAPKEAEPKPPASIARTLAEIPVLLLVAAVIAFLVKTFLAQAYYIPSGSMLPQLQIDDRVVVSKLTYKVHDPRRGDIIVFDDPRTGASATKTDEGLLRKVGEGIGIVQPSTDEFIKRVIGLPGETVEGKDGHVFINGHKLIEPYLQPSVVTSDFPKITVKPGRLWVMGDNRTGSADSRVFGQIKISTIVGRALVKVWPFDHASFL